MPLTEARAGFKRFEYDWAYEAWLMQQRIHWLPEEVPMADDVRDWNQKLTDPERNLLTQIFRFFTQSDIEVNDCYMEQYSRIFKPTEIKMMLSAFSNIETVHIAAYSHLLDTIGMPESEYKAFLEYEEMANKVAYMHKFNMDTKRDTARTMAAFGAFTEGLQLFASFAMLMNFPRFNKMKGMGQIVALSVRDESLHCQSIIRLFNTFVKENPEIMDDDLVSDIQSICASIVEMEDKFIDLAFEMGDIEGMKAQEVKDYIRFIADRRLDQLNMPTLYGIEKHPLPWMNEILNGVEHANFFEARATEYSKAATTGNWQEVWTEMDISKSAANLNAGN
ncbi:MAG: ribonucleotide-diphosphate reductase subunit beta [Magnetococcales bacterium]|nr:ribonucleotide-diphosphate reductase subunit beta [Magnetococcales bacterium]